MVNSEVEVGEHTALGGAQPGSHAGETRLQYSERMRHGIRGSLARRLQYGRGESLADCGPRP